VLVSTNTADDAGVYRLSDDTALVLTLDFFTPVVDDPFDFGRVAAANSISDVYAMGGNPLVGLNIVCFPDGDLPNSVLGSILAGAREKSLEAGVVTIGGHSVSDQELKFGMAVVGTIHPDRIISNAGAQVGDVLVLTKPLGTGVVSTGVKFEKVDAEIERKLTEQMATLNGPAARAMVAAGARAATDITGFGLAGHALEMAEGSGVTLQIDASLLPLMDTARDLCAAGIAPGGLGTNREFYASRVAVETGDRIIAELVFDPQTSGGLLAAIPPEGLAVFEREMAEAGASWWQVGRAVSRGPHPLVLR